MYKSLHSLCLLASDTCSVAATDQDLKERGAGEGDKSTPFGSKLTRSLLIDRTAKKKLTCCACLPRVVSAAEVPYTKLCMSALRRLNSAAAFCCILVFQRAALPSPV